MQRWKSKATGARLSDYLQILSLPRSCSWDQRTSLPSAENGVHTRSIRNHFKTIIVLFDLFQMRGFYCGVESISCWI
jgi:hypothetical protein